MTSSDILNSFDLTSRNRRQTLTDLTTGAAQFSIPLPVVVEPGLLENYAPADPTVGYNTAGVLLSLLSYRLAATRPGKQRELITVCLARRQDDRLVELDVEVLPARRKDGCCLYLRAIKEQEPQS
jgi:hypothetical protein